MVLITQSEKDRAALGTVSTCPIKGNPDYRGIVIKKPWGSEAEIFHDDTLSMWLLQISPGAETSLHAHLKKTTIIAVVEGEATIETLVTTYPMVPGDSAQIERGAFHRTRTVGGAKVLETEYPHPHRHDLVRLADKYGRKGKGYEI